MANHDYEKNHPEREGQNGLPEDEYEFFDQEPRSRHVSRETEPEYEEYERRVRRDEERLRREREAERPDYEPVDELEFSMNDVPRGRRRRPRHRDTGHGCLVGAMYTAFVLGVSMFLAALVIIAANEVFAFVKPDRTAVIELDADATASEVAGLLKDAGIIEYPSLFKLYCSVSGATFKSGKYEINANLDYSAIARTLRRTSTYKETVRVTIPEGYTTAQIVNVLVEKGVASAEDLYDAIENYKFDDYDFIDGIGDSKTRLEGYLFPDTYEFYVNDSAPNVIAKFLTNFDNKFTQKLHDRAEELGLTVNEVVTIASMVEREAKRDDERAVVASVIYNRLADPGTFPKLQIDATVQYIVGRAPTADDLKIDDPYNTYLYNGLPPGPIANPGIASLEAVLYPASTSYYYYVARADGSHIFSETLDEHNAAIAEVNAAAAGNEG